MADNFEDVLKDLLWIMENDAEELGPADTVGEYHIHTCRVRDFWETAVWINEDNMAIVARYKDKEKAKIGHLLWCSMCSTNPVKVWDISIDNYTEF